MSSKISGSTITLTRGDTFKARVSIRRDDGSVYNPVKGDTIRFAMKKDYSDVEPLLDINIPIDSMLLVLRPEDTKNLSFGIYVYDVQLTDSLGNVDTFITKARLHLTEEVL